MNVAADIKKTIDVLKKLRLYKSQQDVVKAAGYNPSYFSRTLNSKDIPMGFENAFFDKFPRSKYLSQYHSLFELDDFFSKSVVPEKIDNTDQAAQIIARKKPQTSNVTPVPHEAYMMVEYQDLATAAGVMGGELVNVLPETKTRLVPREYDTGKYLAVRVDGDSMDDGSKYSIPNGSEILIKEYLLNNGDKLPIRGNLFVIVTREGTVFKQITRHIPDESILLHSYNPNYKDYTVKMEDVLQIFVYRKIISNRPEVKPFDI